MDPSCWGWYTAFSCLQDISPEEMLALNLLLSGAVMSEIICSADVLYLPFSWFECLEIEESFHNDRVFHSLWFESPSIGKLNTTIYIYQIVSEECIEPQNVHVWEGSCVCRYTFRYSSLCLIVS